MRILLIGNFSPPYEEESLHNITFLRKLEEDGHDCTVINIAERPATQKNFIDGKNYFIFLFTLLRACWNKDVLHFFTKGYAPQKYTGQTAADKIEGLRRYGSSP